MKFHLMACGLLMSFSADLHALCGVPQPRLVCAEAAHSQVVVIARLTSRRTVPNESDADLNVYRLTTLEVLRGQVSEQFELGESNDSGRADFDWKVGRKYVLFMSQPPQSEAWAVESCGNSGPLSQASNVLKKLRTMSQDHSRPSISGMVSTDSWTTGLPAADVVVSGTGGTFKTQTDTDGRFQLRVPEGSYTVTSRLGGWSFRPALLTHEDPRHIALTNGTCAQVQLEGSRNVLNRLP